MTAEKLAAGVVGNVETLKTGQTERGVFSLGGTKAEGDEASAFNSISFQLLLAANPSTVVVVPKGTVTTGCPGVVGNGTTPEATAGVVCLYLTTETNLENAGTATALTAEGNRLGVNLVAKGKKEAKGDFVASGVWATKAP